MKPYYEHDGITIYHGDCREVLPAMLFFPATGVIVMDPPYGINHTSSYGSSWENTRIANDNSTDLRDWLIERLSPCPMVVFGTWKIQKPTQTKQMLVWDKGPAFGMGDLRFPWKNSFEEIYVIGNGFKGKRDEGVLRGAPVVSWESRGRKHPHEKPTWLMAHFIGKSQGDVLDPCMGTGPTLIAAKDLGRKAIGIEIEERYCEIAAKRLAQGVLEFTK